MTELLATGQNKKKISVKYLLLTVFVFISMVAWPGISDLSADEVAPGEYTDETEVAELNAAQEQRVENLATEAANVETVAKEAVFKDPDWNTENEYKERVGDYTQEIEQMRSDGMGWGDIVHQLNRDHGLDIPTSVLGLGHGKSSQTVQSSKHSSMQSGTNQGQGLALGHANDNSNSRGGGHGGGNGGGNGGGKK